MFATKKTWIGNGQVVLPNEVLCGSSVLVENGKIACVGQPCPVNAERYDAQGGYILSGFIDVHVHGGGGADFMDGTAEAFRIAARAHAQHGTTALVPTTMTCDDSLLYQVIDCFLQAQQEQTDGAQLLGLHLEGPYFSPLSKGAQPVGALRIPTQEALETVITRAQGRLLRWDAAPELPAMELFASTMRKHNITASVAHTHADAQEAQRAFDWGFSHVTHFYNMTTTFHKKNGRVHAGVIEATYLRDDVTIELIADGMHIPKQSMLLAHRIKGADSICLITDAMRAAGTSLTHSILGPKEGGVPVVIQDGVAQLTDRSAYAGSICTMDRALRTAHIQYGLPLPDVSRMLSLTPAKLCGVAQRKGSIETGKDADLVLMTPDFQVKNVMIGGKFL